MKDAGFVAQELVASGYTTAQLLRPHGAFQKSELEAAGATGLTPVELKAEGFSAGQLKIAGFAAADLKKAGFTPTELKSGGFTHAELLSCWLPDSLFRC